MANLQDIDEDIDKYLESNKQQYAALDPKQSATLALSDFVKYFPVTDTIMKSMEKQLKTCIRNDAEKLLFVLVHLSCGATEVVVNALATSPNKQYLGSAYITSEEYHRFFDKVNKLWDVVVQINRYFQKKKSIEAMWYSLITDHIAMEEDSSATADKSGTTNKKKSHGMIEINCPSCDLKPFKTRYYPPTDANGNFCYEVFWGGAEFGHLRKKMQSHAMKEHQEEITDPKHDNHKRWLCCKSTLRGKAGARQGYDAKNNSASTKTLATNCKKKFVNLIFDVLPLDFINNPKLRRYWKHLVANMVEAFGMALRCITRPGEVFCR